MLRKHFAPLARTLMMIVTLGLLIAPLGTVTAQTPEASPIASPIAITPSFEEAECMYDLPAGLTEGENTFCGWVTAPMYPDGSAAGTVTLPIIRVASTSENPEPDPLLILLGGPGQNMSAVLPMFSDELPYWNFMLERQDVILFDQRGMGMSTPTLSCPFERIGEDGQVSDANIGFAIVRCGAELQLEGIDPSAFTTQTNAADIEAIRIAMGYDQVNLYGISYGSKLALSAIRDYPDSIRSTIIASPLPLEQNPFADQTIGFSHALTEVWDACAADPICAEANPDPETAFLHAVERLKREPINVIASNPMTGESIELPIDHYQFLQVLYLGVFVGDLTPLVPYLVTSVAEGDDTILQMFGPMLLVGGGLSMGALFTYFCQDEVPFSPVSETSQIVSNAGLSKPFTDGSWISLGDQTYTICRMWDFPPADQIEAEAVTSDEPLLILTGTFDPITPASNGGVVQANFPNSQWVNFTAMGHDPASTVPDCSGPMILDFLDDPMAEVEASCADTPVQFPTEEELDSSLATPVASPEIVPITG